MNTSLDTLMIEIDGTTKNAKSSIDSLVKSLDNLKRSLSSVAKESSNFSKIKTTLKSVESPKVSVKNSIKQPKAPFSDYGSLQDQLKSLNVDIDLDKPISSVKTLNSEIRKYRDVSGSLVTVNKKTKGSLEGVKVSVKELSKVAKHGTSVWGAFTKGLSGTLVKFSIFATAGQRMLQSIGKFVDKAGVYEEALNLFTVTMGDYTEQAMKFVNTFSKALYLDPTNVMQYMGSFNSLVEGLGTGSDKAFIMSKNLTQLTYDLASFKNLTFEEAFLKLQSGISGEIEPLRNVGVALSQATLQELAYSLGLQQRVETMSEAEKSQLRYIQIMKSSIEWQTDMGRTLISPANALRVVRQQFSLLGQAIGRVFIPIVMETLPYIMVLTQLLTKLANKLARFFGYKIQDIDYSGISGGLGDINVGIKDIGDSAGKTANKLNTMLAPFDDLNVVQNKTKNASGGVGGLGGGAGDLGVDLPQYDALANLSKKMAEKMKVAEANMKKLLPLVLGLAGAFALIKIAPGVLRFFGLLSSAGTTGGIKTVSKLLGLSSGCLAGVLGSILLYAVSIGKEIPKLSKAFDDLVYNGKGLSEVSKDFSAIDYGLLTLLGNDNIGRLTLLVTGLVKTIGFFNKKSIESTKVIDTFGDSISKASKQKLKPLVTEFENLNKSITDIDLTNNIVTEDDIKNVESSLSRIKQSIIKELDTDQNKQLGNLKTIEKSLGIDKANELMEKSKAYYDGQKNIVSENSNKISEILQNAKDNNVALEQSQIDEINKLRNEMYETGVRGVTKHSGEYYSIMSKLKSNLGKLSTEQASEYIQNAIKTRDETIKSAQEQYDSITAEAYKMYDTHQITEEEYNKIVESAEKTKQDTIKKANDQYDEIYNATTKKLGDTSRYIDEDTGKIKSNWKIFTEDLSSKWNGFTDGLKVGFSTKMEDVKTDAGKKLAELKRKFETFKASIPTPHFSWNDRRGWRATGTTKKVLEALNLPTTIPKLDVKWYEQGGFPNSADLFFANENGVPEMVGKLGNKTAVANNDQIATSITNALITALDQYDFGGDKAPTVIYIGNKQVYEGYGEYINNENDRYGTNTIRI